MSKHTSGPWSIVAGVIRYMPYTVTAPADKGGNYAICHVDNVDGFEPIGSSRSNAELIARAPELLEQLQAMTRFVRKLELNTDEAFGYTREAHQLILTIDAEWSING